MKALRPTQPQVILAFQSRDLDRLRASYNGTWRLDVTWDDQPLRRMMNWEYEGFFRIGMHHRHERDAIVQHGTMTLIRAAAVHRLRRNTRRRRVR